MQEKAKMKIPILDLSVQHAKIATEIQQRAFEVVPYLPTGQWTAMTAYHKNVKGIINAPAFLMWNIEKA